MNTAEKLTAIAQNEQRVADANAELEEALYSNSVGGKSWYDKFWDAFQKNGTRTLYNYAFHNWHTDCFKPKYDITPSRADYMFQDCFEINAKVQNLKKLLDDCGVKLDTSKCTNFSYMLNYSWINEVGVIDTTGATSINAIFVTANRLVTVEKLILKDDGSQTYSNVFGGAVQLKNIVIEGVFGSSINLKESPLTKASITSIINALSSTASGQTATFNKAAKEAAFTADEWATLIATKPNWTISLV